MKIILLNTFEKNGGAAIACNRLMQALNKNGVTATMLVRDKTTDDSNVVSINNSFLERKISLFRFIWERLVIYIANRFSKENLFKVSIANTGNDISRHPLIKEADIIHIHWINHGFLSLRNVQQLIALGKPIVWTMHDQWAYTGICHHTSACNKFEAHCMNCPKLNSSKNKDLSFNSFIEKRKWYQQSVVNLVGCSQWITNEAEKSAIINNSNIISIPNPIDTSTYKPYSNHEIKKEFQLPEDKKLILWGACKITDKRKGIDYLIETCELMIKNNQYKKEDLLIVVFGGFSDELVSLLPYAVHNVGYINSIETMVKLYNVADLFLTPSLEDNLPNTIMESLACGTPCVGFNIGGIPEMIDHKRNGYIAEYKNSEDLANGIHWVLNEANYDELCVNARQKVLNNYSDEIVAKRYIELYYQCLENTAAEKIN